MEDGKMPDLDRPVTVRDLIALAEHHHVAMAHITSCLIKISTALRVSDESLRAKEGKAVYDEIDEVIASLEKAARIGDEIAAHALGDDNGE